MPFFTPIVTARAIQNGMMAKAPASTPPEKLFSTNPSIPATALDKALTKIPRNI